MTKWEYMYAKAEDDKILEVNGQEVDVKGLPISSSERPTVNEFLEKSGQEGWEVVGICPASDRASVWRLILKHSVN